MKNTRKLFSFIMAIFLFSMALNMTALADDCTDYTVYARNSAVLADEIKSNKDYREFTSAFDVQIDKDTIMPLYYASLLDYAKTGDFAYEPYLLEGEQIYVAAVTTPADKFAGNVQFLVDGEYAGIMMYIPAQSNSVSIDFRENTSRVLSLTEDKFKLADSDIKLMFVEGIGYVYYLSNETGQVLIATGFKGTNGNIFTNENNGIISIDTSLREKGYEELAANAERANYLELLPDGENPKTGGLTGPAFIVTNEDSNTLNAFDVSVLVVTGLAILTTLSVGILILCKRKGAAQR